MAEKMARGELRRGDPLQAVYHLAGLCQSGFYQFTLLNLPETRRANSARIAPAIDAALDTFYRAWGPDSLSFASPARPAGVLTLTRCAPTAMASMPVVAAPRRPGRPPPANARP